MYSSFALFDSLQYPVLTYFEHKEALHCLTHLNFDRSYDLLRMWADAFDVKDLTLQPLFFFALMTK